MSSIKSAFMIDISKCYDLPTFRNDLSVFLIFSLFHECSVVNTLVGHSESRTTSAQWKDVYDVSEILKDYGDRGVSPLEALLVQGRRPGLERTVSQADQTGRLLTVQMMTSHHLCLGHHRGVSACTEAPKFPIIAHTEHRVRSLRRGAGRPNVPPPPDP